MREIDRLTVECCGVPYPKLMEMAGARVVEAIIEHGEPITKSVFLSFAAKAITVVTGLMQKTDAKFREAPGNSVQCWRRFFAQGGVRQLPILLIDILLTFFPQRLAQITKPSAEVVRATVA